ncbi:uncharacterized protein B0I36DRAFT_368220 [Microdochium trichocladiopsis]|uniref:Major facilitator superfamily domain-containing protein n=1 Tax=Microdochium trichocladiopsis TaxID=1682393 RepID=A0A9P9BJK1_9PEZI|nr:uncharacterized protein B0I36DRAFT_368220 [Microdochium trichocladiopsis]KAH7018180.1 hypothetical protein B0I36DRAFT_368220 [Microdochium trichocladiopsis]
MWAAAVNPCPLIHHTTSPLLPSNPYLRTLIIFHRTHPAAHVERAAVYVPARKELHDMSGRGTAGMPAGVSALPPQRSRPASTFALLALLLLVQLATSLYQLPLVRLVERRLCRDFYDGSKDAHNGDDIDESLCKVDEVQQHLAWILGAMETAWIVGDFVMAIPLGFVAERFGQRAVLWLTLVPRLFMLAWAPIVGLEFGERLPIAAVIVGPLLSFLGGDCVFGSITYSLAAGSTHDYVARASLFGYMSSVSYITNLLGPGLASATMGTALWLPFVIGIILLLLAVPAISLLPGGGSQSLTAAKPNHAFSHTEERADEQQPFLPSSPLLKAARSQEGTGPSATSTVRSTWVRTKAHIYTLRATFLPEHSQLGNGQNLPLLMASFFLTSLASSDTKLLPQYMSKRYGWRFVDVGYLLSCKAVVNFVLLVFIVPRVLKHSRHEDNGQAGFERDEDYPHLVDHAQDSSRQPGSDLQAEANISSSRRETKTNVFHARVCLAVSLLGALLIASAGSITVLFPALGVYALGSALPVFTFSLLKSPFIVPAPGVQTSTDEADTATSSVAPSSAVLGAASITPQQRTGDLDGNGDASSDHQGSHFSDGNANTSNTETQLFAVVMMVKTLGSLLGAPLMATLWVRGISIGGGALGIPYLVSSACYGAAIGVFAFISVDAR